MARLNAIPGMHVRGAARGVLRDAAGRRCRRARPTRTSCSALLRDDRHPVRLRLGLRPAGRSGLLPRRVPRAAGRAQRDLRRPGGVHRRTSSRHDRTADEHRNDTATSRRTSSAWRSRRSSASRSCCASLYRDPRGPDHRSTSPACSRSASARSCAGSNAGSSPATASRDAALGGDPVPVHRPDRRRRAGAGAGRAAAGRRSHRSCGRNCRSMCDRAQATLVERGLITPHLLVERAVRE